MSPKRGSKTDDGNGLTRFNFLGDPGVLSINPVDPVLLGDVNMDGVVDFFDIQPFIDVLAAQTFQAEADIDGNMVVDFFDIQPFIDILAGGVS